MNTTTETNAKTLSATVVGASGYSGEELVRLLARHPSVHLSAVTSRSQAGKPVAEVIPCLRGQLPGLCFTASDPEALAADPGTEVVFLALPHGVSAEYAVPLAEAGKVVFDLSADFRLGDAAVYADYYGAPHPAPEWLARAPYVVPELASDEAWRSAPLVACPGCYPTSVQLPLVPLLRAGLLDGNDLVINSYSGVSGAGKKVAADYLYCERNESLKAYGIPRHRHLSEIEEQLSAAAGKPVIVQFSPHLVPLSRGISTTIAVPSGGASIEALYAVWEETFRDRPFVHLLPPGTFPDTRLVAGTNRADLSAVKDPRTGRFIITAVIDNLLKGASGQAVQLMNLRFGFGETEGLI